jgi:hypothetical protein
MRKKKVAYVSYGHKREIWGKDATQTVKLLDTLDMNNSNLKEIMKESQRLIRHPWFFYFGGQSMFTTENINIAFNVRGGCFLLMNRWDVALSLAMNYAYNNGDDNNIFHIPIGLASKYYFPMTVKKQRISPYLGIGIDYVLDGNAGEEQINLSALAGVSWALGPGSLDVGIQYGKVSKFALTAGYTFFPWGH